MAAVADATIHAFVGAWNEPNAEARLALLEQAWAEDGTFADPAGRIEGRAALHRHIGEVLEATPDRTLQFAGWLDGFGGRRGFRWRLRLANGSRTAGYASARTGADGRLTAVETFPAELAPAERRSAQLAKWALANPLAVAGVAVLFVYLVLRFQAEQFYEDFGATPEDAGFGGVELMMRQSTQVLLDFLTIGAIWSALYLGVMLPLFYFAIMRGAGRRRPAAHEHPAERRAIVRGLLRWGALVGVFGTLFFGGATFVWDGMEQAGLDADRVRRGGVSVDTDFPWQARPVSATWRGEDAPFALPNCENLVYLGENGDRVLLFDRVSQWTFRVNSADVQLTFPPGSYCEPNAAPSR